MKVETPTGAPVSERVSFGAQFRAMVEEFAGLGQPTIESLERMLPDDDQPAAEDESKNSD